MTNASNSTPPERICAVIPVYNNETTVGAVLTLAAEAGFETIVVDDGSTDSTPEAITGAGCAHVVVHETNAGKGAALLSGFRKARSLGFTHAITIDADGQHNVRDLARLAGEVGKAPSSLVIGVRNISGFGRPQKSRILRAHSNFWVWAVTGKWIGDTQSGLRAYPLDAVLALNLCRRKYDFEIEVLVKSMWAGTPIGEVGVDVSYGEGSKSHFRPLADFFHVATLNMLFLVQAMFLPLAFRRHMHMVENAKLPFGKRLRGTAHAVIFQENTGPVMVGASLGVGVCFGILPIWGFQMIAAAIVAHYLGLSKAVVLAASNISIPAMMPLVLYASIITGRLALHHRLDLSLQFAGFDAVVARQYLWEYVVGALILAFVAGLAVWALTWLIWRVYSGLRKAA